MIDLNKKEIKEKLYFKAKLKNLHKKQQKQMTLLLKLYQYNLEDKIKGIINNYRTIP